MENFILSDVLSYVFQGLTIAVVAVLLKNSGPLISLLFDYLRGLTTNNALLTVIAVAEQIVLHLNQSMVEPAKKAFADGKITEEEAKTVFKEAKKVAVEKVTSAIKDVPSFVQPFIESKVEDVIESAVAKFHKDKDSFKKVNP